MIVVDLGCAGFREDHSIPLLIDRFQPEILYGFDPLGGGVEHPFELRDEEFWEDDVPGAHYRSSPTLRIYRLAAWTYTGELDIGIGAVSPLAVTPVRDKNSEGEWNMRRTVKCMDFAGWLKYKNERRGRPDGFPSDGETVVKMNIEGGEFPLLEHLIRTGADRLVDLFLVSWHDSRMGGDYPQRRKQLEVDLHCPIEVWTGLPSSSPTCGDQGKTG